ncbi:GNAT family N-acetyltransferase [Planctomicrobium sp. SH527]|uniref:GNAT family N-acetyltransferase n=1 Tax=Planctomicrobium sp. SH527 TaxID=3448123 RepID=UPI003F5C2BF5
MNKIIEVETVRLRLRQWLPSDFEPFADLNADPRVMEFFPSTLSRDASYAAAERWQTLIANQGWGPWAVELRETGTFIGFVGLKEPSPPLHFSPCVEVAWRLAQAYWGKGYATEAANAALKIGFEQLQLNEIVSFTAVINKRSQAVMKRLAMQEAPTTFMHPAVSEESPLSEHCLYRLSRRDWMARQLT